MSKKKILRAMEGKHHDKKPKYSRKGRKRWRLEGRDDCWACRDARDATGGVTGHCGDNPSTQP